MLQCFCITAAFLFAARGFAQESVDSAELRKAAGPVEFINNTAAPDRIDSRDSILELGRGPGSAVLNGAETYGARNRYFVIHRLYPPEFDKIDADIFGLGVNTGVDTIASLRLIIQGYLQSAYKYSDADSALLAEYITIYNAVYRQNRPYFEQRYKTPLLNDLTPGSEGIALNYREWPGKTLMLVPLMNAAAGSLSAIDTTAITDPAVIEQMREDDDKGINSRKDMVDLKEREADAAAAEAEKQQQANAEKERQIAQEKERIAEEKAQIEEERKTASPERLAELDKSAAELASEEQTLDEREEALKKDKESARETAEFAERKAIEAQSDRDAIAADQRELIAGASPAANAPPPPPQGMLAIRLPASPSPRGTIIKVDPSSGATMRSSALTQVAARTLTFAGGKTIAAAVSDGKARLIEVDPETLQMVKQGEDELNPDTSIWISGTNLYAIAVSGGKNYIVRFDLNLTKQAQSSVPVHAWAAINFQGDRIITQNAQGTVIFLNASDLKEAM
jgi:hypothetical protein